MSISPHLPVLPGHMDRGIALCGAGGIVTGAHLPAYRKCGFRVQGIFDLDHDKARAAAAAFDIPKVYESLNELLGDDSTDIVDIALPATENVVVVDAVGSAGKAMLIQKPLAEDYETAQRTVEIIDGHGVIAAVNQQMRWEPGVRMSHHLHKQGALGELFNLAFLVFVDTPWHMWEWIRRKSTIDVLYHSIHYIDSIRYLTGAEPVSLFCDGSSLPGYDAVGETRLNLLLTFPEQLRATVLTNHHASYGIEGQQAQFRVEGTNGLAVRTMGLLMNYPDGSPDIFRTYIGETWQSYEFAETWFPDAFVGTMASVMRALDGDIEHPETDVHDNLRTLRLVFAAYESMRTGNSVTLS
ncbi:MAG: Gfo/Idh/MocA family oxidoreductase [Candidatus Latescibacterota bacterium]|nr:Gfo/Idh/MocA family oxidoreductase [Candidatus Latescibacterota bacterium]